MTPSYHVNYQGPCTTITHSPDGPWPRWDMARAAAIEHLRDHVAECELTLMCIRRAGSFGEYVLLREEMEERADPGSWGWLGTCSDAENRL